MHEDGCPCVHDEIEPGVNDESVEVAEVLADAAVEIAQIEAETEVAEIEASLEHHRIEADLEETRIEADHEEIMEEIEADEELAEAVEELEETLAEPEAEESVVAESPDPDDHEEGAGDPVSVAPPPRVEPPNAPKKARHQSAFSKRHSH